MSLSLSACILHSHLFVSVSITHGNEQLSESLLVQLARIVLVEALERVANHLFGVRS